MGYSHGKRWTNEMIEQGIKDTMAQLNLQRMPSKSEIEFVMNNSALSNKIAKTGGFYYWAEKLNLDKKQSETLKSMEWEYNCMEFLSRFGNSELTPLKFPYDVLYQGCCKIDVKVSKKTFLNGSASYSFNLEYKYPKCDFYVFYCVDGDKVKDLVVPAHVMTGKKQLCIGLKSKYDIYEGNWADIFKYAEYMKMVF